MTVVTTELARAHGVVAPPLGRGTLRLLENDDPAAPPETAITVALTFSPIGAAGGGGGGGSGDGSSSDGSGGDGSPALVVPLADLLTLRVTPASPDRGSSVGGVVGGVGGGGGGVTAASLTFLRAGAVRVPALYFYGGPAAAAAFVDALRDHAYLTPLTDEYPPAAPVGHPTRPVGDLYVVDAKRRHRRAPASLLTDDGVLPLPLSRLGGRGGGVAPHAADGAPLLLPPPPSEAADGRTPPAAGGGGALPWPSPRGPAAGRPAGWAGGRVPPGGAVAEVLEERLSTLGFSLLGQFARVTAAARELGEEVARTFDPAAAIAAAAAAAGGGAGGVGGGGALGAIGVGNRGGGAAGVAGPGRGHGGGLPAAEADAAARAAMAAAEAGEASHGGGVRGGAAAAPAAGTGTARTAAAAAAAAAEADLPPALVADEPRGVPVSSAAWAAAHDARERRLYDPAAVRYAVYRGGVEGGGAGAATSARPDVWPGLLGVWPWDASVAEREAAVEAAVERWMVAAREWQRIKAAADAADVDGKGGGVARVDSGVSDRSGGGGGGGGAGDGDGSSSGGERDGAASPAKRRSTPPPPPAPEHIAYHEQEHLIAKDVARSDPEVGVWSGLLGDVLNVYATHNGGLGYCQGMADVLAPILVSIAPPGGPSSAASLSPAHSDGAASPSDGTADGNTRTAAVVYAAFTHLMRRLSANFRVDQSGLASQLLLLRRLLAVSDPPLAAHLHSSDEELHVCFRWVMLQFKRELAFADTCRLWEVSWSRPEGGERLHLYAAVGLLRAHRTRLLALPSGRFDCLLRYINDVGGRVTVDYLIGAAEKEASRLGELLRQQGGRRYEG